MRSTAKRFIGLIHMVIPTLAAKELRLLLRDPRAVLLLLATPFVLIVVLGMILGEGFGQRPDDRLRIAVVNLDQGYAVPQAVSWLTLASQPGSLPAGVAGVLATQQALVGQAWSRQVLRDLALSAEVKVELIPDRATAQRLLAERRRAAVLVFGPDFSARVDRCSFLADGINPFYRDGVDLPTLDAVVLKDDTQLAAAAIMEQVVQVTMLRTVLPWMIGRAFEKLGDPVFLDLLGQRVPGYLFLPATMRQAIGAGVAGSIQDLFPRYNLTGKTWTALTKSTAHEGSGTPAAAFRDEGGTGPLRRGALLYQTLVPAFTVAFAFFLVLTVGWLFTAERRQGTLIRLRAAPLTRGQRLIGKLLPCLLVSVLQGLMLLVAGKLAFGMSWGSQPWLLVPVVVATSLAAMGLALVIAGLARTESQVAIYGTLVVLALALIGGCLVPRALMPERLLPWTRLTPHAWALDAYTELLLSATPNLVTVATACAVLIGFGGLFLGMAWAVLRTEG